MFNLLLKLTENDKRMIFAILLIVILLFVLCGYIGMLIVRLMKWQGKKIDHLCHDVVVTKVITDKKHLLAYGKKKNWRLFFAQAVIPIIIMSAAIALLLIYDAVKHDFSYNPFDSEKGFGSLFFQFELTDQYVSWWIFALRTIRVSKYPTFSINNWCGYLFCPAMIVGGIWYLIVVGSFMARGIRLRKLCTSVFEKTLEGYNQNTGSPNNPII